MVTPEANCEKKKNPVRPVETESSHDVCLLEERAGLGLAVPDERAITEYFRKPETLALDRKKKGYSGGGDRGEETPEVYEK